MRYLTIPRLTRLALPLAIAGTLMATAADARSIRYATGYAAQSIGAVAGDAFAEALDDYSGGELTAKVYPQSLLSFSETPSGVRDGLADSGLVLTPYFPAEFPSTNLAAEISMLLELTGAPAETAGLAYAGAMSEYLFNHCPECTDEFDAQNQVFIGGGGTSPYFLLCNKPVRTMEELQGKRMRIGGAQWSRWVESMGASPVSVPQHETYEALSQGVVDCSVHSAPELTIVKLMEVVSDLTTGAPGGVFAGVANTVNKDTWSSLGEDERRAVLHASAVLSAELSWGYAEAAQENMKTADELDSIEIHEASDDMKARTREFIQQDLDAMAATYADKYDIGNAGEMIETFKPILEKWVSLVDGVDSGEALADLYWEEVFSKVDVSRYGQ
ncbi:TRAP-type C4-dicarboxylate transport system, substrate-binding protein [Marinobacter segnicrescens]|uniref:TRAP-type C4-dicarboxylate transport system, substrate-binding protein n=1 Tax=Marinobacter segnicrescens TaxID=430453 RepID=A0A1I0E6L0_9GAMM|nr:C4-dicarboxylate TRAP transporter substrate-binding protein [Marinobacter segnicrescens]SET40465.1 TRAP-type C4-dicarboxylate transport system, substrate-binding protein [Marinobacter segnicrescens]